MKKLYHNKTIKFKNISSMHTYMSREAYSYEYVKQIPSYLHHSKALCPMLYRRYIFHKSQATTVHKSKAYASYQTYQFKQAI